MNLIKIGDKIIIRGLVQVREVRSLFHRICVGVDSVVSCKSGLCHTR